MSERLLPFYLLLFIPYPYYHEKMNKSMTCCIYGVYATKRECRENDKAESTNDFRVDSEMNKSQKKCIRA